MMQLLTPKEMAERVKKRKDASYSTMADQLGVSKSAVGNALSRPSTRRVKMLRRLLELQGDKVTLEPHYPVE